MSQKQTSKETVRAMALLISRLVLLGLPELATVFLARPMLLRLPDLATEQTG